jgi:hypothetical protein
MNFSVRIGKLITNFQNLAISANCAKSRSAAVGGAGTSHRGWQRDRYRGVEINCPMSTIPKGGYRTGPLPSRKKKIF